MRRLVIILDTELLGLRVACCVLPCPFSSNFCKFVLIVVLLFFCLLLFYFLCELKNVCVMYSLRNLEEIKNIYVYCVELQCHETYFM